MVVYGARGMARREQAYALLAAAARRCWGMDALPEIRREEQGKPYFPLAPQRQFNLSHSGSLVLCALDSQPVGVDIQAVKCWREGLPGRVCSGKELAWLEGRADRWTAFTLLWAMKESRVKFTGAGLRTRISSIAVPLPRTEESLFQLDGLWFRIYRGEDWQGAVCGLTPPPEEIFWLDGLWENSPFTSGENPAIITERQ